MGPMGCNIAEFTYERQSHIQKCKQFLTTTIEINKKKIPENF